MIDSTCFKRFGLTAFMAIGAWLPVLSQGHTRWVQNPQPLNLWTEPKNWFDGKVPNNKSIVYLYQSEQMRQVVNVDNPKAEGVVTAIADEVVFSQTFAPVAKPIRIGALLDISASGELIVGYQIRVRCGTLSAVGNVTSPRLKIEPADKKDALVKLRQARFKTVLLHNDWGDDSDAIFVVTDLGKGGSNVETRLLEAKTSYVYAYGNLSVDTLNMDFSSLRVGGDPEVEGGGKAVMHISSHAIFDGSDVVVGPGGKLYLPASCTFINDASITVKKGGQLIVRQCDHAHALYDSGVLDLQPHGWVTDVFGNPCLFNPPLVAGNLKVQDACPGVGTGSITVELTGGVPPFSYAWSTGDTTPSVAGLMVGAYTVTLTDSTGADTVLTASVANAPGTGMEVWVNPPLCGVSSLARVHALCNDSVYFHALSWGPGFTQTNCDSVPLGTHIFRAITDYGCPVYDTVAINCLPPLPCDSLTAGFDHLVVGDSLFLSSRASNAAQWTWTFGDGETSSQTSPFHVYAMPGTYAVRLTVTDPTGLCSRYEEDSITIAPLDTLPLDTAVTIAFRSGGASTGLHIGTGTDGLLDLSGSELGLEPVLIRLVDMQGRVLRAATVLPQADGTWQMQMDVAGCSQGIYFLQVWQGGIWKQCRRMLLH